jgi:4-carboxymuconolactone decarboxylase
MPEVAALAEAPALTAGEEALVALSAALGTREPERVRSALLRALPIAGAEQVEEVILQAHLFIGFPDVLDALAAWRELSGLAAPANAAGDDATWERRGEEVCRMVYARNYEKLRANVRALHPDLERWMVVGGYGRVLGREALPLVLRELAILALLAVWNAPRQLHSHLRGALNAGAPAEAVERAVELAAAESTPEAARAARALWAQVRERIADSG